MASAAIGWCLGGLLYARFREHRVVLSADKLRYIPVAGVLVFAIVWLLTTVLTMADASVGINFDPKRYLLHDFTMDDLHQVWQKLPDNTLIMDNRTPEEFAKGHVPGSLNIPLGTK